MRLDRYLSHSTGLSRSDAKRLLRRGEVTVNGAVTKSGSYTVAEGDVVEVMGREQQAPGPRYFMLHKPDGVVCASKDARHITVTALLDEPRAEALHPVGRLDIDTTGLVLLTDDGAWSHAITAPRHKKPKVYRVWLAEPLDAEAAERFRRGVELEGESKATLPAGLEPVSETEVLVTLHEGRYHQIKRMFAALGNHVAALHRESIGPVVLDPALAPGDYRPLTPEEIEALR